MKTSINLLATVKHAARNLFFGTQLLIITMALPSLYYVGITHNTTTNENTVEKQYRMTNKGKKLLPQDETKTITIGSEKA